MDIDETIAMTNVYWAEYHIKTYGNPESLTAEEIIRKYRFVKDVPYWDMKEAKEWVETQIDSNEAKLNIPVIEDAIAVVNMLPIACYLTNRPASTNKGTKTWLSKHDFPNREIFASDLGIEWKAEMLISMYPEVDGLIDDNEHIIPYLEGKYKGTLYLFSHKDPFETSLDVRVCPTWRDVYNLIIGQQLK